MTLKTKQRIAFLPFDDLSINRFITNGKRWQSQTKTSRTFNPYVYKKCNFYLPNYQFPLVITWWNYVISYNLIFKIALYSLLIARVARAIFKLHEIIIKCNFQIHQEIMAKLFYLFLVYILMFKAINKHIKQQ